MAKSKKSPVISNSDEWITLISARIKELRKEKGYTSYESFALDHGLDRKQYWRVENGANITIKTLVTILAVHNKDLIKFIKELEAVKKRN